jgi:CheY-like chemotaxis protein
MRELITRSLGPAIRVNIEVPASLPAALVDPNQLELALLNLAVNARDAMEGQGGGTLTIVAQADTITEAAPASNTGLAPGQYVRLQVTDTGCGMDETTLAHAVEPFFSTKEVGRGTGLGLSMVHGLALQSGGAFRLASAVDVGTTATLWLPVARQLPAAMPAATELDAPMAPWRAALLLVDDEPLVRASTAELLQELGYEVAEAGSAAEALDLVRTGYVPELMVTDHMMPGMSGARLAAELRARVPGLPVLMVTGYASLRAEETHGLEVLAKPFAFAELATRIAALIEPPPRLDGNVVNLPVRSAKPQA